MRLPEVIGPDGPSGESHNPLCPPVGGDHQPTPSFHGPSGTPRAQRGASERARADASHPCDACEGHRTIEQAIPGDAERYLMVPCPVCQGSGRISDENDESGVRVERIFRRIAADEGTKGIPMGVVSKK